MSNPGRFMGTAKDLSDPRFHGRPIRLRLDGDCDDPATWHLVKATIIEGFRGDTAQSFVKAITVQFHDGTPEAMFNDEDEVEFAVLRPDET